MPLFYIEIGSGKGGIDKVEADLADINEQGWLVFYQMTDKQWNAGDVLVGYPPDGPGKPKKFWREGSLPDRIDNEEDG